MLINTSIFKNKSLPKYDYLGMGFSLANKLDSNLSATNLIYIDIKSAFPTILNLISYDEEFLFKLNKLTDKLEKNSYISNYFKYHNLDLTFLNRICKFVLFEYIEKNYKIFEIFEYYKDGILFRGIQINDAETEYSEFFKFKLNKINEFYSVNQTSIYFESEKNFSIKGKLKKPTKYIQRLIIQSLTKDDKIILSSKYKDSISMNLAKNIYSFSNEYYLTKSNSKDKNFDKCFPESILIYFLCPLKRIMSDNHAKR